RPVARAVGTSAPVARGERIGLRLGHLPAPSHLDRLGLGFKPNPPPRREPDARRASLLHPRSTLVIAAALPLLVRSADEEFDPDTVTPGVWGFVLTFLVMVVVVLLVLDMVRRIRRVNYRAGVREKLGAEGGGAGGRAV